MARYTKLFSQNIKGWQSDGNGQGTGHCPFHDDKHSSFSGNEKTGLWICFACGAKGNTRQFIQYLINNNINKENKITTNKIKHNAEYVSIHDVIKAQRINSNKEIHSIFKKLPWSQDVIDLLEIDFDGSRLVFPYFDVGHDIDFYKYHKGIDGRRPYTRDKRTESVRFYPLEYLDKYDCTKSLYYAEGEPDAVTLISQGYNAVTHINGALSVPKDLTPIGCFKEVIIIFDNDETGRKASNKLAGRLNKDFPSVAVKIVQWDDNLPKGYDVTDFFIEIQENEK